MFVCCFSYQFQEGGDRHGATTLSVVSPLFEYVGVPAERNKDRAGAVGETVVAWTTKPRDTSVDHHGVATIGANALLTFKRNPSVLKQKLDACDTQGTPRHRRYHPKITTQPIGPQVPQPVNVQQGVSGRVGASPCHARSLTACGLQA